MPPPYEIANSIQHHAYQAVHLPGPALEPYQEALFSLLAKVHPADTIRLQEHLHFCLQNSTCQATLLFDQDQLTSLSLGMPIQSAEEHVLRAFSTDNREWHLHQMYYWADLFIDPTYRHQGLGLKLMLSTYSIIPTSFTTLVFAAPSHHPMDPFWERLGFQKITLHISSSQENPATTTYWVGERSILETF